MKISPSFWPCFRVGVAALVAVVWCFITPGCCTPCFGLARPALRLPPARGRWACGDGCVGPAMAAFLLLIFKPPLAALRGDPKEGTRKETEAGCPGGGHGGVRAPGVSQQGGDALPCVGTGARLSHPRRLGQGAGAPVSLWGAPRASPPRCWRRVVWPPVDTAELWGHEDGMWV